MRGYHASQMGRRQARAPLAKVDATGWAPFEAAAVGLRADVETISRQIHDRPETAFEEVEACALLSSWLDRNGFSVEVPLGGLPTAFRATSGHGHPRVAYLVEYDALAGLGHTCGHHLIAAGGCVAAAVLRRVLPEGGEVSVIGTPAEEGGGGKIRLLDAGIFEGVDAALMFHPTDRTLAWRHSIASVHLRIRFHGRAAHAAKAPEEGRNALAAMIQFFVAVDGLRQHMRQRARVHGVITNGGTAPNVVPDLTEAAFLVRDVTVERALALASRVRDCAQGAAMATGTEAEVSESGPTYAERKNNHPIAQRVAGYLGDFGIEVEPASTSHPAGSSDVGNVSLVVPTIHPYLQVVDRGVENHTEAFRDSALTDRAHDATFRMALALARTGFDLLTDHGFLAEAKGAFEATGADLAGEG
jgi:amidohydrolase